MEIYFIRHAESANNRLWTTVGSFDGRDEDPELTDLGVRQTQQLTRRLTQGGTPLPAKVDYQNVSGFGLTHIYTSLMVRSIETATPVAAALNLPLVALTDLHEFGGIFQYHPNWERYGLPGNTPAQLRQRFPHLTLPADLPADGWWQSQDETRADMAARAQRVLAHIHAQHAGSDDRAALISHGGFYQTFLHALLALPLPAEEDDYRYQFSLNNTGITRCQLTDGRVRILYMNRTDHLDDDLITR